MATHNPTPAQQQKMLEKVLADTPREQPVVMLNLLRFQNRLPAAADSAQGSTGQDVYQRYVEEASACAQAVGAEVIWSGRSLGDLLAPPEASWDQAVLVRYPSIDAFMAMIGR